MSTCPEFTGYCSSAVARLWKWPINFTVSRPDCVCDRLYFQTQFLRVSYHVMRAKLKNNQPSSGGDSFLCAVRPMLLSTAVHSSHRQTKSTTGDSTFVLAVDKTVGCFFSDCVGMLHWFGTFSSQKPLLAALSSSDVRPGGSSLQSSDPQVNHLVNTRLTVCWNIHGVWAL